MSELLLVALICAATIPVDQCTRETAADVIVQPAPTPIACLYTGQVIVADRIPADHYLRVNCERRASELAPGERRASK